MSFAGKMRLTQLLLAILAVSLTQNPSVGRAQEKIILTRVRGSSDTHAGAAVVKEAYRRLGMDIKVYPLQGKVALEASNSGKVDGEVQRIDGIDRKFTNLVQVPIPVNYLQGAAFSKDYHFPIKGWFSLQPYRIGIVRGIIFAEQGTQGMDVKIAENYAALVALLEKGEVDLAVMPRINGQVAIKKHNSKDIKELQGVLETLFLYHYLHKKNERLVPQLEKILKRMLLDGTTRKIRKSVYDGLLRED
jgi:polar amino acid transport system substrate-binding protein